MVQNAKCALMQAMQAAWISAATDAAAVSLGFLQLLPMKGRAAWLALSARN